MRMLPVLLLLGAGADATVDSVAVADVLLAVGLVALALILLLLEFLIVSYGMLALAALGCAIGGITLGFFTAPVVGWALVAATPPLSALICAWGLRRLVRSSLVPKQEITEDAGYRHATASLGINVGDRGTLITDALPTGRARFPGGDIDVQSEGQALAKGMVVTVRRIEGPTVFVSPDAKP